MVVRTDVVGGVGEEVQAISGVATCVAGAEVSTATAGEEGEEVREGARSKMHPYEATTRTTARISAIVGVEDRSPIAEDVMEETGSTMVGEVMAVTTRKVAIRHIVAADRVKATPRISVRVVTVKTALLTGIGTITDTTTSRCPLASRPFPVVTAVRRRRLTAVHLLISRLLVLRFESSLGLGVMRLRLASPLS